MLRWSTIPLLLISLVSPIPATTAQADVLVSNLSEPLRGASPIGNAGVQPPPPDLDWSWAAQSFAPDNALYSLVSLEAIVGDGSTAPAPDVVARLHADNAGSVGALLTSFTAPSMSGAPSARTFLPDDPVVLLPNTTYWFVLGSRNDGTYFWPYAEGNGSTGPGSLLNYAYSADSGASWEDYGNVNPFFLQVNVNPIPEPGSLTLCSLTGVALLAAAAWKKRRPRS